MIYHYTKLGTLLSMLSNVVTIENDEAIPLEKLRVNLWATSAYFLNDSTETLLLPNVLRKLEVPFPAIDAAIDIAGQPFVLSFSRNEDGLSLWKMYADDGCGITLGFNEDVIKTYFQQSNFNIDYIGDCEYITEELLKEKIENNPWYQYYLNDKNNAMPLLKLYCDAMRYKHKGFENENEYRIIFCRHADEEYRIKDNAIIPYYEIPIPLKALKTITIGPCLDKEITEYTIRKIMFRFLEGYQSFKVDIKCSQVPYRG